MLDMTHVFPISLLSVHVCMYTLQRYLTKMAITDTLLFWKDFSNDERIPRIFQRNELPVFQLMTLNGLDVVGRKIWQSSKATGGVQVSSEDHSLQPLYARDLPAVPMNHLKNTFVVLSPSLLKTTDLVLQVGVRSGLGDNARLCGLWREVAMFRKWLLCLLCSSFFALVSGLPPQITIELRISVTHCDCNPRLFINLDICHGHQCLLGNRFTVLKTVPARQTRDVVRSHRVRQKETQIKPFCNDPSENFNDFLGGGDEGRVRGVFGRRSISSSGHHLVQEACHVHHHVRQQRVHLNPQLLVLLQLHVVGVRSTASVNARKRRSFIRVFVDLIIVSLARKGCRSNYLQISPRNVDLFYLLADLLLLHRQLMQQNHSLQHQSHHRSSVRVQADVEGHLQVPLNGSNDGVFHPERMSVDHTSEKELGVLEQCGEIQLLDDPTKPMTVTQFSKWFAGGLFDTYDLSLRIAFRYAVENINRDSSILSNGTILKAITEETLPGQSLQAEQKVCRLLKSGATVVFGPQSPNVAAHVQSICDAKEIPHIETRWDSHATDANTYSLNLYPHPASLGEPPEGGKSPHMKAIHVYNETVLRTNHRQIHRFYPSSPFVPEGKGANSSYRFCIVPLFFILLAEAYTSILIAYEWPSYSLIYEDHYSLIRLNPLIRTPIFSNRPGPDLNQLIQLPADRNY
ncbi:unnamed protein product, partial [Cyprideis torosa]